MSVSTADNNIRPRRSGVLDPGQFGTGQRSATTAGQETGGHCCCGRGMGSSPRLRHFMASGDLEPLLSLRNEKFIAIAQWPWPINCQSRRATLRSPAFSHHIARKRSTWVAY